MISVTTSNLNGIRAAVRKGLSGWVDEHAPDVWCMEEVRAPQSAIDPIFDGIAEQYASHGKVTDAAQLHRQNDVCRIAGRAGVAELACLPVEAQRVGLEDLHEDVDTGRWIEQDLRLPSGHLLTVATAYVHSGDIKDPVKMGQKRRFLDRLDQRMTEMSDEARADSSHDFVVCGDFNVCHTPLDIKNAKGNVGNSGFLPEERAHMDHWLDGLGFHDVLRDAVGPIQGPYTWWSQRGHAFDTNTGWRIDYQFATPRLAASARSWRIDKADSYKDRWSDHAALTINYDL